MRAILDSPAPDQPRRAYAAWLRANQNAYRADFIETQLELAQKRREHRRVREWAPLSDRCDQILKTAAFSWRKPLAELIDRDVVKRPQFMRGFVEYITIDAEQFDKRANDLFSRAPILHVSLTDVVRRPELFANVSIARLVTIDISGQQVDDETIETLARSPHVRNVRLLDISANRITQTGLDAICASPNLKQLLYVNCVGNKFADPTDIAGTEGEEIIQTDPSDAGAALEKRFGRIGWLHAPDFFDVAYPPTMLAVEPS